MENVDITKTGNARFTVFPLHYPKLWDLYQKHLSTFWVVNEILLTDDLEDWDHKLNDNERHFITNVLAFFASSDGIVNENIILNFYTQIEIPEVRQFYSVQIMMEAIHNETYSLLIDTYIKDTVEKNKLFNAIETVPAVKQKADWALKYMNNDSSLLQKLIAYVCVEGIFFSGSFCAIYWLKSRGLMPGLATANEFIARDEALHAEFAIQLYHTIAQGNGVGVDGKTIDEIFREAVDIEKIFITESLPVSLLGMNCNLMKQYIEFVADRWLVILGRPKMFKSTCPFGFMEMLSLGTKENFFEVKTSMYSRAGVGKTEEENTIGFDDEF